MKKLIGILIITLLITTAIPTIGITNDNKTLFIQKPNNSNETYQKHFSLLTNQDSILWDNGIYYTGAFYCQWDSISLFDGIGADDFQFEETTEITGINWVAGYGELAADGDFDYNITFYIDRGDGRMPGDKIFEQVFTNDMVHETFIEETSWNCSMFSYSVELQDPLTFEGGNKYWISIQGVGNSPPDSVWGCHYAITLNDLVFKSHFWNLRRWYDSHNLGDNYLFDFCFQLTGDGEPVIPDLECEYDIIIEDVPPGTMVNVTFTVINNGDVGSFLVWEVLSYPDWGTNWLSKWIYKDYYIMDDRGYVGSSNSKEIILQVQVPDERNQEFSGEITLVNIDDPEDTCTINIVCKTPRNKSMDQFQSLIDRLIQRFPILELLI